MLRTVESLLIERKIKKLSEEVGTNFVDEQIPKGVDANVLGAFEDSVHRFNYVSKFLEDENNKDYLEWVDRFTRNVFFNLTAETIDCHAYLLKGTKGITRIDFDNIYRNAVAKSNQIIAETKMEGEISERVVFSSYINHACKANVERESRYFS